MPVRQPRRAASHLALLGLSRLADGASPERLPSALAALDGAARLHARAPAKRPKTDRTEVAWTDLDETSLGCFRAVIDSDRGYGVEAARRFNTMLTPAASRRAAGLVLEMKLAYRRHDLAAGLSDHEALQGTVEREALIASLLVPEDRATPLHSRVAMIAQRLASVCAEGDGAWAERVAVFFEGHSWDTEAYLGCVEALAPTLKRLGGAELVRGLAVRLRDPLPTADLAQPWAHAPIGGFDA